MSAMKDRDVQDRDLLEVMLKEHEARLTPEQCEAFESMLAQKWPLSDKQSDWVRTTARRLGALSPPAENLFSSMTPEQQARHRERVQTKLPWELGEMARPKRPPGGTVIKGTGIFVSDDDREEARKWAKRLSDAPCVKVGTRWLPDVEQEAFNAWLDALAQKYGLPEPAKDPDGDVIHYGMNLRGEFTTWVSEGT
jgi:hypothetical protein